MEKIKNFNFGWVPQHSIVVAVTTESDCCDMERYVLAEHQPEYGDYTLIRGGHCSCYDFDDVEWDAIVYSEEELIDLMAAWWAKYDSWHEKEQRAFAGLVALSCDFFYRHRDKFPGLGEWIEYRGDPDELQSVND